MMKKYDDIAMQYRISQNLVAQLVYKSRKMKRFLQELMDLKLRKEQIQIDIAEEVE